MTVPFIRGQRRCRAALICAAVLFGGPQARVHAERYALAWEAPVACPDRDAARARIEHYLGSGQADQAPLGSVQVRIAEPAPGLFQAEVTLLGDDEAGARRIEGRGCGQVAEAAALIAAMLLDPASVAKRAQEREPAPEPEPEPAPEPEPEPELEPGPEPEAADGRLRLSVGVQLLGDLGSLPEPTPGAGLALGLHAGALHAELRGAALWPRATRSGPAPGSGGELGLYVGGLRGRLDLVQGLGGRLGTGPSVGLELGSAVGVGQGLADPEQRAQLWAGLSLGWAVQWFLPSAAFGLGLELLAPLHRPTWVIDDFGAVFRPKGVVGRASLELALLLL